MKWSTTKKDIFTDSEIPISAAATFTWSKFFDDGDDDDGTLDDDILSVYTD